MNSNDNESTGTSCASNKSMKRTFEESQGNNPSALDNSDSVDIGGSSGDLHLQSGEETSLTRREIEDAVQAYRTTLSKRLKLPQDWDPPELSSEDDEEGTGLTAETTSVVREPPAVQVGSATKDDSRSLASYFPKLKQWNKDLGGKPTLSEPGFQSLTLKAPRWEGPLDDYASWHTYMTKAERYIINGGHQHPAGGIDVQVEQQLRFIMMKVAPLEAWQQLSHLDWLRAVDDIQRRFQVATLPTKLALGQRPDGAPDIAPFLESVIAMDQVSAASARDKKRLVHAALKDASLGALAESVWPWCTDKTKSLNDLMTMVVDGLASYTAQIKQMRAQGLYVAVSRKPSKKDSEVKISSSTVAAFHGNKPHQTHRRQAQPKEQRSCFMCDQVGHYAHECPKRSHMKDILQSRSRDE